MRDGRGRGVGGRGRAEPASEAGPTLPAASCGGDLVEVRARGRGRCRRSSCRSAGRRGWRRDGVKPAGRRCGARCSGRRRCRRWRPSSPAWPGRCRRWPSGRWARSAARVGDAGRRRCPCRPGSRRRSARGCRRGPRRSGRRRTRRRRTSCRRSAAAPVAASERAGGRPCVDDLRAVDVEAQVGAVVGRGEVRPRVQRQRRRAAGVELAGADVDVRARAVGRAVGVERRRTGRRCCSLISAVRQPPVADGLTHASSVMPVARSSEFASGDDDPVVGAVERERAAEASGGRCGWRRSACRRCLARSCR